MANVELHPIVTELSKSFTVKDGLLVMTEEDAKKHLKAIQGVRPEERDTVCTHLVALAFRFKEQAAETADGAISLLITFTIAILGAENVKKVGDMFGEAGMGKQAQSVIGATQSTAAPARMDDKPKAPTVKATRGLRKPT